jgi:hypothetical protein
MKNLLFLLIITALVSCKKDADKTLINKNWVIASATITPARTVGNKTTTDLLELAGPGSCEANTILTFSKDGNFTSSSNGALCDLYVDPKAPAITWRRDGDQIFLSSAPSSPMLQSGEKLSHTTNNIQADGTVYTILRIYKAKSK